MSNDERIPKLSQPVVTASLEQNQAPDSYLVRQSFLVLVLMLVIDLYQPMKINSSTSTIRSTNYIPLLIFRSRSFTNQSG
jgi:hypothetical protein